MNGDNWIKWHADDRGSSPSDSSIWLHVMTISEAQPASHFQKFKSKATRE
jgi:hypothetical protein